MNEYLQSAEIFKLLGKYRKPLIIAGAIALIASIIFSGPAFIKPKFKSFAILYPTNLIVYSQESPTEQMVQLLQSSEIRDRVIKAFDLYKHYDIDSVNNQYHRTTVTKMFDENVSVNKTEFESVEIVAYDTDPNVASAIVDSMIHYMNLKARELQREKSKELLEIQKARLELKKMEMDSIEGVIQNYRAQYGLLDYKTQAKEYARAYGVAMASGSQRAVSETKKMLEILGEKGGEFDALNEHLWRVRGTYNDIKLDYENALKDVTKQLTYENIITHPIPSDKKAYPVRWLIVVVSVSVTLFLAFLIILAVASTKKNV